MDGRHEFGNLVRLPGSKKAFLVLVEVAVLRFSLITRLTCICTVLVTLAFPTFGHPPSAKLAEMLPNDVGSFHQLPSMRPLIDLAREGMLKTEPFELQHETGALIGAETEYLSPEGEKLTVEILKFQGESYAYSFLTFVAERMREANPDARLKQAGIGTVGVQSQKTIAFFKGTHFVRVTSGNTNSKTLDSTIALARLFADRIDKGEGDVPVLVKHLPDYEAAQETAVYLVSLEALKSKISNEPVFDAITFEGGAEAVVAKYGPSQFVIVEFTTPQLAGNNDWNIQVKIRELWSQGKPSPTAYRRVGNYSVFVFNAPNEQTANQLIDQVQYEQVVQWLGDNPYWLRDAQKRYTETMLGTFVSVMKASGLAAVLCLGVGGLMGGLLFTRRRAQQAAQHGYSDAGGMMRLNIDELTAQTDPHRLLGPEKR